MTYQDKIEFNLFLTDLIYFAYFNFVEIREREAWREN